jgi:Amt family ammonium transporter
MLVTQIASASGVIGWTAIERACYRRPSSLGMISGAIAGLVGITPASGSVGAMGAICIGFVTGVLCFCFCTYVKEAIGTYDDSLDVFGIHGIGGIVGAILTAVWCAPKLGGNGFGTIVLSGGEVGLYSC